MKKLLNILLLITLTICSALNASVKSIKDKAAFDVEVTKSTKPSIVKFYSDSCGPCRKMKPIFEALSNELGDKYNFIEINSSEASGICEKFSIRSIPVFIFFKDGKEVKRSVGSTSKAALKSEIESNLN